MNEMKIHVQFFAHLSERFGAAQTLCLEAGASTADLLDLLCSMKPETSALLAVCRIATDERILSSGETLPSHVCVFPPMSGG